MMQHAANSETSLIFCMNTLLPSVFLACLLISGGARADEKLWSLLQGGGHVVLIRHAVTTPGAGDPAGFRLDDCATQRNLTDAGRRHAQRIGAEWRARKIPVERVLSSPWCRCIETAQLAFGKAEVSQPLGNLFGRYENREAQVRALRELAAAEGKGNIVMVTHGSTIAALTGINPGTGEMVILAKGAPAGRLSVPE
jgi:broad specificity phosphatase PhoE